MVPTLSVRVILAPLKLSLKAELLRYPSCGGHYGANTLTWMSDLNAQLHEAAAALKASPTDLIERVRATQEHVRQLEREVAQLKAKLASAAKL